LGPLLGAHMSIAGGLELAPGRGKAIGCEAIQIFSGSPRSLRGRKPIPTPQAQAFQQELKKHGIQDCTIHTNYLVNLASPDPRMIKVSRKAFIEEMERAQTLGVRWLVTHPGSHMGKGESFGLRRVAESLDVCFQKAKAPEVTVCLENTAGQGSNLGCTFGQLEEILEACAARDRLGVCIDTCHTFASGYDLRSPKGYAETMRALEEKIGMGRVKAFHLNDSKEGLGRRVDRHAHIGKGKIGKEGFRLLVNDERFFGKPMLLETPGEDPDFARNLRLLRSLQP